MRAKLQTSHPDMLMSAKAQLSEFGSARVIENWLLAWRRIDDGHAAVVDRSLGQRFVRIEVMRRVSKDDLFDAWPQNAVVGR